MIDGILKVDKPSGPTSHDVVDRVRFVANTRRVGHAGTLDPFASGLLLMGIGKGTRMLEYLTHQSKVYDVVMRLGITTDTFDRQGRIIEEKNVFPSIDEVEEALKSFVGEYDQVPPVYSSKKYKGKKLYELARQGKIIRLPPKKVKIERLEIFEIEFPYVHFKVEVSEGTYIRALCRDVGWKLGCGAIAQELRRESIGKFTLQDAIDVYSENAKNEMHKNLLNLEEVSAMLFPTVVTFKSSEFKIANGQKLKVSDLKDFENFNKEQLLRVVNEEGKLLAIALSERKSSFIRTLKSQKRDEFVIRPKKVFA